VHHTDVNAIGDSSGDADEEWDLGDRARIGLFGIERRGASVGLWRCTIGGSSVVHEVLRPRATRKSEERSEEKGEDPAHSAGPRLGSFTES
jgi:hypothetical protein